MPPKSAAPCDYSSEYTVQCGANLVCVRPSKGFLEWHAVMKGECVHRADRKRWLMSRRLFPAVRQTPEKAEVTSVTLSLLGEQRRKLLFGFPKPGDQLRVRVTGTRVENDTGGHLPPCLLSRNGKR